MVLANPGLAAKLRIYGGTAQAGQAKSIVKLPEETSFLQVIAADADSQHGGTSHLLIIDELHTQPNRELVDTLGTSMASENRAEPLMICITTADFDRESICNEKHAYACRVRDGTTPDPAFLPVIYEAKTTDNWKSEAVWAKVNPNLNVSVSLDYLRRECIKAQDNPSLENTFKRLHLNMKTAQETRWISAALWSRCAEPFDDKILLDRECYGGLDFGWRDDYAALVLVFPINNLFYVLPWFWLPTNGRRDKRLMPTQEFIARGLVTLTPGNATDIEAIYQVIRECRERYDLKNVAIDPNNARKQGQDLMTEGIDVVEFFQTKKYYNEPCRFLESILKEGRLRHGGNRVLTWMAGNTMVEENSMNEIMPAKQKNLEKIDGICALLMGLKGTMLAPPASVYESRGLTDWGEEEKVEAEPVADKVVKWGGDWGDDDD